MILRPDGRMVLDKAMNLWVIADFAKADKVGNNHVYYARLPDDVRDSKIMLHEVESLKQKRNDYEVILINNTIYVMGGWSET